MMPLTLQKLSNGDLLIRLDPTSAKELSCPHKFMLHNMCGLTSKTPKSATEFGQAMHRGIAHWLRSGKQDAIGAIGVAVEYLAGSDAVLSDSDPRTPTKAKDLLQGYFDRYSKFDPFTIASDTQGKLAIELPFSIPFMRVDGVQINIAGVLDALGELSRVPAFKDIKTTSAKSSPTKYFEDYETSLQMMFYSWTLKEAGFCKTYPGAVIDGIFISQKEPFVRSPLIEYRPDVIEEMVDWIYEQCVQIIQYAKQDKFPKNFGFCSANFGCDFRIICTAQEGFRKHILNSQFKQREYNPANFGNE